MNEERKVIRLGRRQGISGDSPVWELRWRGRIERTDRAGLRLGLSRGRLSGIEEVRRIDGDWGPLFGRPIYREVFGPDVEPRDHARRRAADRIARLRGRARVLGGVAILALLVGWPGLVGPLWTQAMLAVAAGAGVGAGLSRLVGALHATELAGLAEKLVPPVGLPPPPPEDWEQLAAEDEVASYLRGEKES